MTQNEFSIRLRRGESFLIAADGQYLGQLSLNRFLTDSLMNEYGPYGSRFLSTSIFNRYSTWTPSSRAITCRCLVGA